jgi:uncharacterized membrane protein required for colicin V production
MRVMDISMSLDQLPINLFDFAMIATISLGIFRGRKHGMSEELLGMLKWLTILIASSMLYEPVGVTLGSLMPMFNRLSCYLMAYVGVALIVLVLFMGIKRMLDGKLVGSDIFGRSEYYLGMGSGVVRFTCMLLAALALLNARYFSPTEVRAMQKYQDDVYGSDYFPTLQSVQSSVFDKSLAGPWIKENLGFLLIKPTPPEDKQLHQRDAELP